MLSNLHDDASTCVSIVYIRDGPFFKFYSNMCLGLLGNFDFRGNFMKHLNNIARIELTETEVKNNCLYFSSETREALQFPIKQFNTYLPVKLIDGEVEQIINPTEAKNGEYPYLLKNVSFIEKRKGILSPGSFIYIEFVSEDPYVLKLHESLQ